MALKPAEKEFVDEGGARILIRTQQLPAIPALRLTARLGKMIAPTFARIEAAVDGDVEDMELAMLAPAFAEFFNQLNEKDLESLILAVFASTQAQISNEEKGERLVALATAGNVNSVFEGRLGDLISAMWFVLEHNFADFIGAALQRLKAKAAQAKAAKVQAAVASALASAKVSPAAPAE